MKESFDRPLPTRAAYSQALLDLMARDSRVVALDADVAKSIGTLPLHENYPERAINVGIAEQNMMGIAAGLASCGKIVYASTYAVFASMRACEQIRTFIAYPGLPVKIGASHGGLHTGSDGVTHQAIEDIGIMRSIPGITVLNPSDGPSAYRLTLAAAEHPGPVYLRLTRNPLPIVHQGQELRIGQAVRLSQHGSDVCLIGSGVMVARVLKAAELLLAEGIRPTVLEIHTIRPLDTAAIETAARSCGALVVAEDHNIQAGLGGAVAETVTARYPVPVERIGLRDCFGESGAPDQLLDEYGLGVRDIVAAVRRAMALRDGRGQERRGP